MKLVNYTLVALLVAAIIANVDLFLKYQADNRFLLQLSERVAPSPSLPSEKTIKLVRYMRENLSPAYNDAYFFSPMFKFMKATARQVANQGGFCGQRSRLLVRILGLHGVRASKISLYTNGLPKHAVVEVDIENNQKMVVDPYFGIFFPNQEGSYYGVKELKTDDRIMPSRVHELRANEDGYRPLLSGYPLDRYVYSDAKSLNWNYPILKTIYPMAKTLLGESIDELKRPYFIESPVLILMILLIFLKIVIIGLLIMINRPTVRNYRRRVYQPV